MAMGELSAIAVLILALLHERPMHPYQVHRNLVERGDTRLVRVNAGAIYHGIERLEKEGLVEAAGTERAGNRPERTTYVHAGCPKSRNLAGRPHDRLIDTTQMA